MENGQLNISEDLGKLYVQLPNYPEPENADYEEGRIKTEYSHPEKEGELQEKPPVEKEERGEYTLIFREDNGEVCGFEVEDWDEKNDVSLIDLEDHGPNVVIDPKKI